MKIFNSVSDLQAASLTAGQLTQTKRYFAGQDGGGATYLIKTAVDYAGTPDEHRDLTLANGNIAAIQSEGTKSLFGVIRQSTADAGWDFIDDAGHTPYNLQSVTTYRDNILIYYTFDADVVGTLVATPDETFAKYGITCGASVSGNFCFLTIAAPMIFQVEADGTLSLPNFFEGLITTDTSLLTEGRLRINHPSIQESSIPPTVTPVGTVTRNARFAVSYSNNYTDIVAVGDVDGYVYYNGADWVYSGDLYTPPTFSFSSGELTVTHPEADRKSAVIVSSRGSSSIARSDSQISDTQFKVKFYDNTGTAVTTPNTDMRFFFSRRGAVRVNTLDGIFAVNRSYCGVNHNKLASGSGNIWLMGKHFV